MDRPAPPPHWRSALLLLHALVELSVAVLMWAAPGVFFSSPTPELVALARSFGVGAGAVGLLSLLLVRQAGGPALRIGAITLAMYQAGIGVAQVLAPMPGVPAWVPVSFHAAFALAFAYIAARAEPE